jgi:hypothetical protein
MLYIHTAMWCVVQVVFGPSGERRKRAQWDKPVEGDLRVYGGSAELMKPDLSREHQVLYPLFDVTMATYDQGFMVVGYARKADSGQTPPVIREHRQAWYCIPRPFVG